jgi:hypothetical protein
MVSMRIYKSPNLDNHIDELVEAALLREPRDRNAFLTAECGQIETSWTRLRVASARAWPVQVRMPLNSPWVLNWAVI